MKNKFTLFCLLIVFSLFGTSTLLAQATLSAPADFSVGQSIQPTFTWSGGTSTYTLEIATSSSFGGDIVYTYAGIAPTTFDMSTTSDLLLNNTTYWWRITGGGVSSTFKFTTAINLTPYLAAPVGGLQINSPTVQLYWNVSGTTTGLTYDVFYSSSLVTTFVGVTPQFSGLTGQTISVSGLTPGLTYYWGVRVKSSTGAILGYSVIETFTTYGSLTEPVLLYPTNGTTTYTLSPYVYWATYNYSTFLQYKVRHSLASTVDGNGALTSSVTESAYTFDSYAQLSSLEYGQTYYWQVSATNDGGGTTVYSDVFTFTTPGGGGTLVSPTPTYPSGGAIVYSTSAIFYYYPSDYLPSLQFEVNYSTDNTLTAGKLATSNTTLPLTSSYFKQVAGLSGGTTYYWQVRSYNGTTYSPWSAYETFSTSTSVDIAQKPIPLSPADGQQVSSVTPTVYWSLPVGPFSGYTFTVSYNTNGAQDGFGNLTGTSNVLGGATTTSGFFATFVSALANSSTYYWQVKAEKGASSTYSDIRSFTINADASNGTIVPTPASPISGQIVNTKTPLFKWNVLSSYSHLEFQVLYATDNTVSSGVLQNGTTPTGWTGNLEINPSVDLVPGATYYWQVRSRLIASPGVISNYSAVQTFSISAGAAPVMAVLGSPVGGVAVATTEPVLSWMLPTTSESDLSYEIEIAEDVSMAAAQVISDLTTNTYRSNLPAGKTYYWRVRSKNSDGDYSFYTGNGVFEIDASVTGVEAEEEIPTEFNVSQNYPNPFNPSTTIKFAIPASEEVTVKVFDLLGREVVTLLSSQLEAGSHSVVWNGQNQFGATATTGIYFFRVKSGSNVVTKKMILMK